MSKTGLKLQLSDEDGNVFSIIRRARKAMKRAGLPYEKIKEYTEEMTSGDYDNALRVTMEWFDVEENQK